MFLTIVAVVIERGNFCLFEVSKHMTDDHKIIQARFKHVSWSPFWVSNTATNVCCCPLLGFSVEVGVFLLNFAQAWLIPPFSVDF